MSATDFNRFDLPVMTQYERLKTQYAALVLVEMGLARFAIILANLDASSLGVLGRVAVLEWRLLDKVRTQLDPDPTAPTLDAQTLTRFTQLVGGWRRLWSYAQRQRVTQAAQSHLTLTTDGDARRIQIERLLARNDAASISELLDDAAYLIFSLRES